MASASRTCSAYGLVLYAAQAALAANSARADEEPVNVVASDHAVTVVASEDTLGFGGGETPPSAAAGVPGDDVGFGDDGSTSSAPHAAPPPPSEPSPWSLQGAVRNFTALRTERDVITRLASARMILDLKLTYGHEFMLGAAPASLRFVASGRGEYDFAMLNKVYDAPTRETYQWQAIPGDIFLGLNWGVLDLTVGKQIVPFGQGEVLTSLDVINPRDLRDPIMADPGDLRLAVLMSRVGLRLGSARLEGIVVHETNPGLLAPPLGEFSPIRKLLLEGGALRDTLTGRTMRYAHRPDAALFRPDGMQYHGRFVYQGTGFELVLQGASMLDQMGVASLPGAEALQEQELELDLFHPRYTMLGHSGTFTAGEFVFRWEASGDLNRLTTTRRVDTNLLRLESARFTQLHGMLGVSWVPDSSTNATFEYMQSYVVSDPTRNPAPIGPRTALLWPIEAPQFALRFTRTFLDERISLNALMILIGIYPFNAFAGKVDVGYKLTETFQVNLGYMAYHGSIQFGPMYGFGKNDRVLLNLRWDFALR